MLPVYSISHFLNEPGTARLFFAGRLEHMPDPHNLRYPHRHQFYALLWLETGGTRQFVDYQEYTVPPGSLFFISPGQVHLWEEWEEATGWAVLFEPALGLPEDGGPDLLFELTYLDNLYARPWLPVPPASAAHLRPVLELLANRPAQDERLTRALLRVLLLQIQEVASYTQPAQHPAPGATTDLFRRFRLLLEQPGPAATRTGVAGYAAQLHCTPDHLNRVARQVSGESAGALLQAHFARAAQRLLATEPAVPVGEVARRLGFADAAYFARAFRRATGTAPLAFRRLLSEKYRKSAG